MLKKYFFLLSLIMLSISVFGDRYTISGVIKDANNGESLPSSTIFETQRQVGVNSNTFGYYSITIPGGESEIVVSFLGYETQTFSFVLSKDTVIDVLLLPHSE